MRVKFASLVVRTLVLEFSLDYSRGDAIARIKRAPNVVESGSDEDFSAPLCHDRACNSIKIRFLSTASVERRVFRPGFKFGCRNSPGSTSGRPTSGLSIFN